MKPNRNPQSRRTAGPIAAFVKRPPARPNRRYLANGLAHAPHHDFDERTRLLPLTVKQYHRMLKAGIIEEGAPYELLNGLIVRKDRSAAGEDPMTVAFEHAWAVNYLADLSPRFRKLACFVQTQQPISLPPGNEPEPDAAVIAGSMDDYTQHPTAADVHCVIEVADSSLRRDRTVKLQIYAAANIPCYVIINFPQRVVEVYTDPLPAVGRYATSKTLSGNQRVELPAGVAKRITLQAKQLFPVRRRPRK